MIALRRMGGLVVALEDGLYGFDPLSGRCGLLVELEADIPENRPNDGKCDAAGRLWVGTMNRTDSTRPSGSFYRIDPDLGVTKIEDGLRVPNGLAWDPADRVMYHTDSRTRHVLSYAFDPTSGVRSGVREFFPFERERGGSVDGAAMDAEGGYWTVLYGGGKLIRVTPGGRRDRDIPLPVTQLTMPAFGRPGHENHLYHVGVPETGQARPGAPTPGRGTAQDSRWCPGPPRPSLRGLSRNSTPSPRCEAKVSCGARPGRVKLAS